MTDFAFDFDLDNFAVFHVGVESFSHDIFPELLLVTDDMTKAINTVIDDSLEWYLLDNLAFWPDEIARKWKREGELRYRDWSLVESSVMNTLTQDLLNREIISELSILDDLGGLGINIARVSDVPPLLWELIDFKPLKKSEKKKAKKKTKKKAKKKTKKKTKKRPKKKAPSNRRRPKRRTKLTGKGFVGAGIGETLAQMRKDNPVVGKRDNMTFGGSGFRLAGGALSDDEETMSDSEFDIENESEEEEESMSSDEYEDTDDSSDEEDYVRPNGEDLRLKGGQVSDDEILNGYYEENGDQAGGAGFEYDDLI